MDRSRHSFTRYMKDEITHAAINNKMFMRLGHINGQLFELEFGESEL